MKSRFVFALAVGSMIAGLAVGQQTSAPQKPAPGGTSATPTKIRRTADGHPDFSGIWTFAISIPPGGLTRVIDGKANTARFDQSARHKAFDVKGAQPWTPAPSYKPEFQEKVKYLEANESKLDTVFYCGRPGLPRIGSPRRVIQLPNEM